jgi:predicted dehydrogenase
MSESVKIGVIGAGNIFRDRHFPALKDLDDVEVIAIENRSTESASEINDEFDLGAEVGNDPEYVLGHDEIDAVMVGTWPYKHHQYATEALDRGKHVFVQARMTTSLAEAKEMYSKSEETDLVTQICPSPFAMEVDPIVQEMIQDGYLGELYFVRANVFSDNRIDPRAPIHWRDLERYQGVNALAVGILMERLHRWVGHAERVTANTETHIEERPTEDGEKDVPVDLPDVATVNCEFENGAVGSFQFSDVLAHGAQNQIELYGSDGTLIYDFETLYGGSIEDDDVSEIHIPEEDTAEWTVERDFIGAIRDGGKPRTTFREGVKYMEFSEALCRSVESGSTIDLPLRT